MTREDYWREAIEAAFEEAAISATRDQVKQAVEFLVVCRDQEGMAFGDHCIPNPLKTEIDNLNAKHKKELKAAEERIEIYRKQVIRDHPEAQQIWDDGGDICWLPRGL